MTGPIHRLHVDHTVAHRRLAQRIRHTGRPSQQHGLIPELEQAAVVTNDGGVPPTCTIQYDTTTPGPLVPTVRYLASLTPGAGDLVWVTRIAGKPWILGRLASGGPADRQAGAELGYAEILTGSAGFTTIADVSGLSVTFDLAQPRHVQIICSCLARSTVANDIIQLDITDSSNSSVGSSNDIVIPRASGNVRREFSTRLFLAAAAGWQYKIRAQRIAGTGTCIVNASSAPYNASYIQVVDRGP